MTKHLLLLIISALPAIGWGAGGDTLGNGGGFIENEVQYAWEKFVPVVTKCLETEECNNAEEINFLQHLLLYKQRNLSELSFVSIETLPEIRGHETLVIHRELAINVDILYNHFRDPIQFKLTHAISLLFRGIANAANVDVGKLNFARLSQKTINNFFEFEKTISLLPFGLDTMAIKIYGDSKLSLFISDFESNKDLGTLVQDVITCQNPQLLKVQNIRITGYSQLREKVYFTIGLSYGCQKKIYSGQFAFTLSLKKGTSFKGNIVKLKSSSVREYDTREIH